jgi:hypothetical protein
MPRYFCWSNNIKESVYVWADNKDDAVNFAKNIFLLFDSAPSSTHSVKSCNQQMTRDYEHDIRADQTTPLPLPKEVTDDD